MIADLVGGGWGGGGARRGGIEGGIADLVEGRGELRSKLGRCFMCASLLVASSAFSSIRSATVKHAVSVNMAAEHDAANVFVPQDATAPRRADLGALVDTELLGKPPVLEGEEGECQDWAFMMRSYLGCVNTKFRPALKLIDTLLEQARKQMLNLGPEQSSCPAPCITCSR